MNHSDYMREYAARRRRYSLPMDNPDSANHYRYHRRVNRITGFAILVLLNLLIVEICGSWQGLVVMPFSIVVFAVVAIAVWVIVALTYELLNYLSGR